MSNYQLMWDCIDVLSAVKSNSLTLPLTTKAVRFCLSDETILDERVVKINEIVTVMVENPSELAVIREVFGSGMPTWDEVVELIRESLSTQQQGFTVYPFFVESEDRALIVGLKGALKQKWEKISQKSNS